jgi:hypothetical protein
MAIIRNEDLAVIGPKEADTSSLATDRYGRVMGVIADGSDVAQGALADAMVAAGATGSISAKLRRVTQGLEDLKTLITLVSSGYGAPVTVTRAANQTPYTAGDVVGGVIDFGVMGPANGHIRLTSLRMRAVVTAVPTGMSYGTLHLYNVTPPSAYADNAAWTLAAGDLAGHCSGSGIVIQAPVLPAAGSAAIVAPPLNGINQEVDLAANGHLYGYYVASAGFTPAANSEVYGFALYSVAL